ncbi:MAG: hypothetical protein KDF24_07100 [Rhodocyclaceae bacterium]|nr:hypothetical protein [Rhodocyclaceae bacterium]MCB1962919.1 hypothetical protein [Rhodocyclaceae bacterium]
MNFNDPFGRSAQQQERNYAALRTALQNAGITTAEATRQCLHNVKRNAVMMVCLVIASIALAAWLFPQGLAIVLVCAIVILAWVAATTVNGRRHLERYLREEIEAGGAAAAPEDDAA